MSTPLISGFTFVKNGLNLGYPIRESIESIEPLCDEIIINVGYDDPDLRSDDGTWNYLNDYFTHPKFKFIKSWWDPKLCKDGLILSQQTNIALSRCTGRYCQYIQGDEVIHEEDLPIIHNAVINLNDSPQIDGLVFNYLHFYGNINIVKHTRNIYRREVRLIRGNKGIKSWLDAQGFRHDNNTKLACKKIEARIFHYGWARKEQVMNNKVSSMNKLYHGVDHQSKQFNYERIWGLKQFTQSHPKIMSHWVIEHDNKIDLFSLPLRKEVKNIGLAFSDFIEDITDIRIGEYKNYKLI